MNNKFILPQNICLLGLPGSGKGYYGKMLSTIWNIPLYSTSQILKEISTSSSTMIQQEQNKKQEQQQQQQSSTASSATTTTDLMNTGQLVDCKYVSEAVRNFLWTMQRRSSSCFIMDGYPRTIRQIELMNANWKIPIDNVDTSNTTTATTKTAAATTKNIQNQINDNIDNITIPIAFHINVPEQVCIEKIHGRRICSKCNKEWNVANVQCHQQQRMNDNDTNYDNYNGYFDLPPTLPDNVMSIDYVLCDRACQPVTDWYQRQDDIDMNTIRHRIHIYNENIQPILQYYHDTNSLIQYTPYRGKKDLNHLLLHIQNWFNNNNK